MKISDKLAFISPCIAKRSEIQDENTHGYVSYNLTFEHFMKYVRSMNVYGEDARDEIEYGLGSIYPMPGGLKENVYWFCGDEVFVRQVEGEKKAYEFLEDYKKRIEGNKDFPFMVDILNCDKGCLYGTGVEEQKTASEDTFYTLEKIKESNAQEEVSSVNSIGKTFTEYEGIIYDGAFSNHILTLKPAYLTDYLLLKYPLLG